MDRRTPRSTNVTVISDSQDHYGHPQMLLAATNGYLRIGNRSIQRRNAIIDGSLKG